MVLEAAPGFRQKIGETLPPQVLPVLQHLGLSEVLADPAHLACHGNQFLWGSERVEAKPFFAQVQSFGWHLQRDRFEQQLAEAAIHTGVRWEMDARLLALSPDGAGWRVRYGQGQRQHERTVRFVVDATGRAAKVARLLDVGREEWDRLVGVAHCLPLRRSLPHYTSVEAVPGGWWYCAPLAGARVMTLFLTDADLLPKALRSRTGFLSELRSTRLLGHLLDGAIEFDADASKEDGQIRAAGSSGLSQLFGRNWLAVGDAARAYDPLSSYGITAALGGGIYAGNAIADHLNGRPEALPAYAYLQGQAYAQYRAMLHAQYAVERRWPDAPFWSRRVTWTA